MKGLDYAIPRRSKPQIPDCDTGKSYNCFPIFRSPGKTLNSTMSGDAKKFLQETPPSFSTQELVLRHWTLIRGRAGPTASSLSIMQTYDCQHTLAWDMAMPGIVLSRPAALRCFHAACGAVEALLGHFSRMSSSLQPYRGSVSSPSSWIGSRLFLLFTAAVVCSWLVRQLCVSKCLWRGLSIQIY